MKKYLSLLFLPFLVACSSVKKGGVILDYDMFQNKMIEFENLFSSEVIDYYIYIYSPNCGHCESIKQDVLEVVSLRDNIALLEFSEVIPISTSIDSTIGASNVSDISILGTPTMLEIYKNVLVQNVAGASPIINLLSTL